MSMVTIPCPNCNVNGMMSLLDMRYEGPYRCWKCHENFLLIMESDEVKSCTPMTQEEFDHQRELKKQRDRMKDTLG
jgi:DNA-directed RNA polymerase subunit RPC12/RpoP